MKNVPALLKRKLQNNSSVFQRKKTGNLCIARALLVGRAFADSDLTLCRKLRTSGGEKGAQTTKARTLIKQAGLPEREFSIADVPKFSVL